VFWVISVYFNIGKTLPKYSIFLLGHPVECEAENTCKLGNINNLLRISTDEENGVHINTQFYSTPPV
jgi:hypothetical protein